jgi:hypothetical protein
MSRLRPWFPIAALERAAPELEAATIAYYESLTPEERREETAMAAALSRAGRRLRPDVGARGSLRRRPR